MNVDFRVATTLETNPKFLDLACRLRSADRAIAVLFRLWGWTALHRPAGDLTGVPRELLRLDTEEWQALVDARRPGGSWGFLELHGAGVLVHDWEFHNGYASSAELRSASARKAGKASAAAKREAKARRRAGRQSGMILPLDPLQRPLSTPVGDGVATGVDTGVSTGARNPVSVSVSVSDSVTGPGERPLEGLSLWRAARSRRLQRAVAARLGIKFESAMVGVTRALLEIQAVPEDDPELDPGERWAAPTWLVGQACSYVMGTGWGFRRAGS